MHLKNLIDAPPGSWHYTQPQSNYTIVGITFQQLVQRVAQHRTNMNYETVGSLVDEIETAICTALSPKDQVAFCQSEIRPITSVNWKSVVRFLTTMVEWVKAGFSLVPQEEAERRAAICAKCPFNVGMHGCAICRATVDGLRDAVMKASTSQDTKLQACGVCGCDNPAQVHIPIGVLRAGTGDLDYPAWCWKAKGGVNESAV